MLERITNIALLTCAIVVGLRLIGDETKEASTPPDVSKAKWEQLVASPSVLGPDEAQYQVVVFTDYQCPYCRQLESTIDTTRAHLDGDLQVIYRHFPLVSIHPRALDAAVASTCASLQGRFEDLHPKLFLEVGDLSTDRITEFAAAIEGLDVRRFVDCLASDEAREAVETDVALAKDLGVIGTPTLVVQRHLVRGNIGPTQLTALLQLE